MAFKILSATFLLNDDEKFTLNFNELVSKKDAPTFSLLIGENGVGKSQILNAIAEFLFYVWTSETCYSSMVRRKSFIFCTQLIYTLDGKKCKLNWSDFRQTTLLVDDEACQITQDWLPMVVTSSFSICDKFRIIRSQERQNYPYYKYMGAKVNGNMISPTSILFTLLSYIAFASGQQLIKINKAICNVGYELALLVKFSLHTSKDKIYIDDLIKEVEIRAKNGSYAGKKFARLTEDEKKILYEFYSQIKNEKNSISLELDFTNQDGLEGKQQKLFALYKLRQLKMINLSLVAFKTKTKGWLSCMEMSSGEFNMLATLIGIASVASQNVLVLMDEVEISQHPLWQMSVIDYLDSCLRGFSCHLMIATHSHFLVSDLPLNRSDVLHLYKNEIGRISCNRIEQHTYGWSAEEVLLKVFGVPTTRNRYLAGVVGELMNEITNDRISFEDAKEKIMFLKCIVGNLNEIDPMKKIIEAIVESFDGK